MDTAKKDERERTGIRENEDPEPANTCPFCPENVSPRIVEEFGSVFAINDHYPVTEGHMLIIPRRHTHDFFTMSSKEKRDAEKLLQVLQRKISQNDSSVTGFNVGTNCGVSAGQSVMHAHIHLIPRRDGDTPQPRGGVRGVIPRKMDY